MGADRKANIRELVRSPGGLLQRVQRRVACEDLGESSCSFRTEVVASQTASTGTEVGAGALTRKNEHSGAAAHLSEVTALPLSASHSLVMPSAV